MENRARPIIFLDPSFLLMEPLSTRPLNDQVLVAEGDISEMCSATWLQMLLLKVLHDASMKLKKHIVLQITTETMSEVGGVMKGAESAWI